MEILGSEILSYDDDRDIREAAGNPQVKRSEAGESCRQVQTVETPGGLLENAQLEDASCRDQTAE